MGSLFANLDTPKWISPIDSDLASAQSGEQFGRNFSAAFLQSRQQAFQKDLLRDKLKAQTLAQVTQAQKLAPIAAELAGTQTPEQSWERVSKNPQWLVDPQTAPLVGNFLKTQAAVAAAQKNSIEGTMAIRDGTEFLKRLDTIGPEDRAAIKSMTPNQGGGPSAMQWQALSVAEKAAQVQKENANKLVEVEALARGDVPTTTISPKGVTTTFRPPKAGDVGSEPQTKQLKDGTTLAWMPNGKTIHVIRPNGDKKELTPTQLLSIGKALQEQGDPDAANLIQAAKAGAMERVPEKTKAPSAPTTTPAKFTKGERAKQNGVIYEFDGANWNTVQ